MEIEKPDNLNVFKIPLNQDAKKKEKRHNTNNTEQNSGATNRQQLLENNERNSSYQYLRNKELRNSAG